MMAKHLPIALTAEELEKLLAIPALHTRTGLRNRAILECMARAGLRVSEVCNLTLADVGEQLHVVRGKGAKDRNVPVCSTLKERLDAWRAFGKPEHWLFPTHPGGQMSTRYVELFTKAYALKAGLEKRVTPHTLRHTFATMFLNGTGNLRMVQEALGHSRVDTTQIYTHIDNKELAQAIDAWDAKRRAGLLKPEEKKEDLKALLQRALDAL